MNAAQQFLKDNFALLPQEEFDKYQAEAERTQSLVTISRKIDGKYVDFTFEPSNNAAFQSPALRQEGFNRPHPPISNTGGKHTQKNDKNKQNNNAKALIDYLTIVIPDAPYLPADGGHYDHDNFIDAVNIGFLSNLGLIASQSLRGGKNFYSHSWAIQTKAGDDVGFVAHGGNKESLCISISGSGTQHVGSAGFLFVRRYLIETGGHITRIDLAHDCFNGEKNIEDGLRWYHGGVFRSGKNGNYPKAKFIDDFGSGAGRTLYVGNRKSGKLFRIYEKGKQLGDVSSLWVRFELELHNVDRDISPDILLFKGEYLSGSYECMNWIEAEQSYIKTQKNSAQVTLGHLEMHAKRAYGRLLNLLMVVTDDSPGQVIERLLRVDGYPRRLSTVNLTAQD